MDVDARQAARLELQITATKNRLDQLKSQRTGIGRCEQCSPRKCVPGCPFALGWIALDRSIEQACNELEFLQDQRHLALMSRSLLRRLARGDRRLRDFASGELYRREVESDRAAERDAPTAPSIWERLRNHNDETV